jgi:hypothetical protein
MEFHKLEGAALDAYLKLIDAVKKEAARVNNMTLDQAWGVNGALELLQLLPANIGRATLTSTTHYGYRYSVGIGATQGILPATQIAAQRVVGIYGYVDTTPGARMWDQMQITIGTRLARQWPLKPTFANPEDASYRFDPIVVPASKQLTITVACHQANYEEFTFLGVFAQPKA